MRWLFAFICPPLALIACGKPFQAILNVPLCFMFYFPAVIHAFCACTLSLDDQKNKAVA